MTIKSFKLFESSSDIDAICKKFNIKNYSINPDGSIDVSGRWDHGRSDRGIDLINRNLTKLPLKFRHVSGDFYCSDNQLTSLEGCPTSVGGNFNCSRNQLTSLEGCPESVGGNFYCSHNQLTSLEGSPTSIGGHFTCYNNQLTSLKGCPESIGGDFGCSNNQIKDFDKPIQFRNLNCFGNPIYEIYQLNPCKEFVEYLIEYQVIRDNGTKIVKQRLIKALEDSEWRGDVFGPFKKYQLI